MDDQLDQGVAPRMKARPQQPTAGLPPTETLVQILDASLQGLAGWERQQARLSFAGTCVEWCGAVELHREIAVKDTQMAERLARTLQGRQGAERRSRIRSLSVGIEAEGAGRSKRAAALISSCSQLESLELVAAGGLDLGTASCCLGQPLTKALQKLSLKTFGLIGTESPRDAPWLDTAEFLGLCAGWPQLQALTLDNISTSDRQHPNDPPSLPLSLSRLQLPVPDCDERTELARLLAAASDTLRHLHFTETTCHHLSGTTSPAPFAPIVAVAPQLHSLVALSEEGYLVFQLSSPLNRG